MLEQMRSLPVKLEGVFFVEESKVERLILHRIVIQPDADMGFSAAPGRERSNSFARVEQLPRSAARGTGRKEFEPRLKSHLRASYWRRLSFLSTSSSPSGKASMGSRNVVQSDRPRTRSRLQSGRQERSLAPRQRGWATGSINTTLNVYGGLFPRLEEAIADGLDELFSAAEAAASSGSV